MTDRATDTTGDPTRHEQGGSTGSREGRLSGGDGADRDLDRDRVDARPGDAGAPVEARPGPDVRDGGRDTLGDGGRSGPDARADGGPGGDDRVADGDAALVDPDRARGYQDRWKSVKGDFVDEPRRAVRDANALVGEVLDDVEATFRHQRERLERDLDDHDASTEDLRLALNRYRSFFDRLLTL